MFKKKVGLLIVFQSLLFINNTFTQNVELMLQTGHQKYVRNIAISPDETKLFSVDEDNRNGILWDISTGRQLYTFQDVITGAFNADSKSLLICSTNSTFRMVDFLGKTIKVFNTTETKQTYFGSSSIHIEAGLFLYKQSITDINTGKITEMSSTQANKIHRFGVV